MYTPRSRSLINTNTYKHIFNLPNNTRVIPDQNNFWHLFMWQENHINSYLSISTVELSLIITLYKLNLTDNK